MENDLTKMKKIIIVATEIEHGYGGIQTALQGYCDGFNSLDYNYEVIVSHNDADKFNYFWNSAFFKVLNIAINNRGKETIFWFHSGPWLSLLRKFTLALVPKVLGCQVVNHIHSPVMADYLDSRIMRLWVRFLLSPYNKLIVLTPWWKKQFLAKGFQQEMFVSANPNTNKLCDKAESLLAMSKTENVNLAENVKILSMARLKKGKGLELVIGAMKLLPNKYSLTIAGTGPMKEQLESLTKQQGLENRIQFVGWVSGNEKQKLFSSHNIFCLPSRYDSFGMVFIEAMAYNLPVIGLKWGPMIEIISKDVGLLCELPNEQTVAENIELLSKNIHYYHNKGPKKVLMDYQPQKAAKRIINFFKT